MKKLKVLDSYTHENLENVFKEVMKQTGLKLGKIAQPVRVALTGKTASPGIFEIIVILGPERVIPRLENAIRYIETKLDKKT
jgi:glutamyl-tRNA synthetase